jgi:hypothetical protein
MEQTHRLLTKLAAGDRLESRTDGALGGAEVATVLRLLALLGQFRNQA